MFPRMAGGGPVLAALGAAPTARDISHEVIKLSQAHTAKSGQTPEGRNEMKLKMQFIMRESDMALGNFVTRHRDAQRFQFLDVCCAPGGFSEFVVASLPNARGFGLSLPPELGGHIMVLDMDKYSSRYAYKYMDVPESAQSIFVHSMYGERSPQDCLSDRGNPVRRGLLIIDGSFLGVKDHTHSEEYTMDDDANPAFNVYAPSTGHKALLVAQLLVVGNNLKAGGTLFLRLDINSPDSFL